MKHDLKITFLLVLFFLASQFVGLFITSQYVTVEEVIDISTGEKSYNVTNISDLPLGVERISVSQDFSWLYIVAAILIGTVIVLLLIRFRQKRVWKVWYLLSMVFIMTFALGPFMGSMVALGISILLSVWKTFRPNIIVHNLTEIFLYGGLAAMLVPIMNLYSAFILLIVISIYDAIAVWQSKHMIKLAEFQSDSNVFAGLFVPYSTGKKTKVLMTAPEMKPKNEKNEHHKETEKSHGDKQTVSRAILGGGDIAFPLIFAGTVMKTAGMQAYLIPPMVAVSLFLLLYYSKKGKFYPAMPFLTVGCLLGYVLVALI
jgi:presenilin-like A22 family membrane protease